MRPHSISRYALAFGAAGIAILAGLGIFAADALANAPVRGKITGHDKLVPDVYADAAKDPHR